MTRRSRLIGGAAVALAATGCTPGHVLTVFDYGGYVLTRPDLGDMVVVAGCLGEDTACAADGWVEPRIVVGAQYAGHPLDPQEDEPGFDCETMGNLRCGPGHRPACGDHAWKFTFPDVTGRITVCVPYKYR